MMHEEGAPLKVAQVRLGHARAETTMEHYTHLAQHANESISAPPRNQPVFTPAERPRTLFLQVSDGLAET